MTFSFCNDILEQNINNTIDKLDEVENLISNLSYEISELVDNNIYLKEEINELYSKINIVKSKLKNNNEQIIKLNNALPFYKKLYKNYKTQLDTKESDFEVQLQTEYNKYILSLKEEQCYFVILDKDTHTIQLLDEFCSSNKDFLILDNQFFLNNNRRFISLIVIPKYIDIYCEDTQPTMTELKYNSWKNINYISCEKLQPLIQELVKIDKTQIKENTIYVFKTPFLIGGQTSNNRTGYGCTWIGGGDYIEGTLYGEVTDFMVVGFIS